MELAGKLTTTSNDGGYVKRRTITRAFREQIATIIGAYGAISMGSNVMFKINQPEFSDPLYTMPSTVEEAFASDIKTIAGDLKKVMARNTREQQK